MTAIGDVPCNGCNLCCRYGVVVLHPEDGDIVENYKTRLAPSPETGEPTIALAVKPDGSCIYLAENGCTVHSSRPAACRAFDCRYLYWIATQTMSRPLRRQKIRHPLEKAVLSQGRKLRRTLTASLTELMTAKTYITKNPA